MRATVKGTGLATSAAETEAGETVFEEFHVTYASSYLRPLQVHLKLLMAPNLRSSAYVFPHLYQTALSVVVEDRLVIDAAVEAVCTKGPI
jgi:hypothetical protein